jgi:hypothetical protein
VPEPVIRWSTYPTAYERPLVGRVERHVLVSELLADNPLGDPSKRPARCMCCQAMTTTLNGATHPSTRDEWYLDFGALAFREALVEIEVTDVSGMKAGHRRRRPSTTGGIKNDGSGHGL